MVQSWHKASARPIIFDRTGAGDTQAMQLIDASWPAARLASGLDHLKQDCNDSIQRSLSRPARTMPTL